MTTDEIRTIARLALRTGHIGWQDLLTRGYRVRVSKNNEDVGTYDVMEKHKPTASQIACEQARTEHGDGTYDFTIVGRLVLSSGDLCELEREMDNIASHAARFAQYVALRGGAGCGDSGHERAVQESQKKYDRTRKFLGYNVR